MSPTPTPPPPRRPVPPPPDSGVRTGRPAPKPPRDRPTGRPRRRCRRPPGAPRARRRAHRPRCVPALGAPGGVARPGSPCRARCMPVRAPVLVVLALRSGHVADLGLDELAHHIEADDDRCRQQPWGICAAKVSSCSLTLARQPLRQRRGRPDRPTRSPVAAAACSPSTHSSATLSSLVVLRPQLGWV